MLKFLLVVGSIAAIVLLWMYFESTRQKVPEPSEVHTFALEFFAGGSITGHTFTVKIADGAVRYQALDPSASKAMEVIERELSPAELNQLMSTILNINFMQLVSQDFTAEPLGQDQGQYRVSVTLNHRHRTVTCTIAPPGKTARTRGCQAALHELRDALSTILDVQIY